MPIFQQGGWFDPYSGSHLRSFAAIGDRVPNRVLIGPWSHEEEVETFRGDVDLSAARDRDPRPRARLLRPLPQGRRQRLGRTASRSSSSSSARNEWRGESEWPLPGTEFTPFFLRERRALDRDVPRSDEPADRYDYDPDDPVPTIGGVNSVLTMTQGAAEPIRPGPCDQRVLEAPRRRARRTRASSSTGDLEVIGPVEMVLFAASSARRTPTSSSASATSTRTAARSSSPKGSSARATGARTRASPHRAARAGRGGRVPDPLLPDGERVRAGPPDPRST